MQNADQKAMRVESLRPILGMGSLLVNETSLIPGWHMMAPSFSLRIGGSKKKGTSGDHTSKLVLVHVESCG